MKKVNINKRINKIEVKNPLKVSVIIPNYNYERFIIDRINSVINQTYPVYEIVILDDCSTDNSVNVIKDRINQIKDIKIKLIENKTNSGCVFSQWQKGLKHITGEYFWIAEADDSCAPTFLETVIKSFEEDKDVVLSYTDSKKINENNEIIGDTVIDWCDIFNTGIWDNSYVHTGISEIKTSFSNNNSILNVSSLLWKNQKEYNDIFEKAKKYKVAGDWYIYKEVLRKGKIAYHHQSLNYFRKHSNSVSTTVNRNIEYKEVYEIQNEIKEEYHLSKGQLQKQIMRRRFMGFVENDKNKRIKGSVAWIIPGLLKGSGGHRTIIQNVNAMIKDGYQCDLYIEDYEQLLPTELSKLVNEYYGECVADTFSGWNLTKKYDMIIATAFNTVDTVMKSDCSKKLYFIQDFEPYFFAMGDYYVMAENTYKYDITGITIGKWLTAKMKKDYGLNSSYFNFCADLKIYKPMKKIKKENSICYIFQPAKPRRCDKIALKALQIVQKIKPDVKIYLYGSEKCEIKNLKVEHLGIIPIESLNELYNKCKVGLCMSASNPSRIPFEMMAAGLPVVELYKENNLYDFPTDGCLLADTTPEAIATAIIKIIDDENLQKKLSMGGIKYMKDYPLEKGYQQFLDNINNYYNDKKLSNSKVEISYTKDKIDYTQEVMEVSKTIKEEVSYFMPTIPDEKISIAKRGFRKLKRVYRRVRNK